MIPFDVQHQPGKPISEQLVYSVKKAVAQGLLQPGDAFPSVRVLSHAFRMNPNTAQKAVTQLTQAGILEIRPGIGAFVCQQPKLSASEVALILEPALEALSIEAKRLGLTQKQLEHYLRTTWNHLKG